MALSEDLKKLYSSNPVGKRYYHTVELSHSQFSKTFYFVKDTDIHNWDLGNGTFVDFEPFPFDIKLPDAGSNQQDMSFVFSNVGREAMPELEAAAEQIQEPIKLTYRTYIDDFNEPQMAPITLVLTNITADNYSVTANATRPDLFKRSVPSGNFAYFDSRFVGLTL